MIAQLLAGPEIGSKDVDDREQQACIAGQTVEVAGRACTLRVSARLAAFADHWPRSDRPSAGACQVFQCADLLEIWLDTVGAARGTRPIFVGLFDEAGDPMMLLPLGIERKRGGRELGFLDGGVSDYNQPVLFPGAASIDAEAWTRTWAAIVRAIPPFDVAVFEKVVASCGGLPNPLLHFGGSASDEAGHAMSLPTSTAELEARLPRRSVNKRKLKQLSAHGPVALEVAASEAEAQAFLDAVVANKARQYERTGVRGFDHPGMRDYYAEATRRLPRPMGVHVSALTCGGEIVACHWGLIRNDRFYMLLTAYAQDWSRYSPGTLLHNALIRWCRERGLERFDFGIGNEPYKAEYCDERIPLYRSEIPNGPAGRVHLAASRTLTRLRATGLWQRLRPIKWAIIRRLRGG